MSKATEQSETQIVRSSDSNTDSDRVLVTKRMIFYALRDLVAERGFSDVSASDIIARSGVSRSTFYRCFSDKYDVANWAYKRYKNIRLQDQHRHTSFEASLRAQLDHLYENQEFFAAVLRYHGQNSLRDYMVEANEEYMVGCWQATYGVEPPYEMRAAMSFAAAGLSYVLERWILDGCIQDGDDVADAICDCIPVPVFESLF